MSKPTQILFVRQRHDAKRAGLHNDYRVVIGEKAFSWASRKDFPEVGKPTILWEQPIHHAAYLNNPDITIPEGQYGAGTQVIDYAQKGNAIVKNDAYHLELNNGDRFLIKKAPDSYGEKAWLFLRKKKVEDKKNPYLEKSAAASPGAEALGGAAVLAVADIQNKKLMRKGVKGLRDHHKEYMGTANKSGKPFSAPYMDALRKGATKNVAMEKSLVRKSKAIRGVGAAIGGGLLAHSLYRAVTEKRASENPYLEKVAALGSSDMAAARSHINKKREESGKSEIGFHDFKEQFEDRRGVSRRVVGTIGLANAGALLNRYNPAAGALVGGVAGYYLGKSFDNKNARKNMIKEASKKGKDDIHGWKRAGVVAGTTMGAAAASTPASIILAKAAFGGKSSGKVTEADVQSYRKSKNLRHVDRHEVRDMGAHYHPAGMAGVKRPRVAGTGPEALLHEYGHAHSNNSTRKKFGSRISKAKFGSIMVSQKAVMGIGALAGGFAATSDNEKARKYAPAAVAAAATPLLVEEARATLSPAKHLWKTKGKSAAGHLLKKLAPAYGTYAVATGAAVGAASWAKHIKNKAVAKAGKGK
jgi:hypothetical protein